MIAKAFVFKNRGLLLERYRPPCSRYIGRPSARSIALGLPLAIAGELLRCWAVGYSGVTTRGDVVDSARARDGRARTRTCATRSTSATSSRRPASRSRSPERTGSVRAQRCSRAARSRDGRASTRRSFRTKKRFLRSQFGEAVRRVLRARAARRSAARRRWRTATGEWKPEVVRTAESKTFVTFGAMLARSLIKARKA